MAATSPPADPLDMTIALLPRSLRAALLAGAAMLSAAPALAQDPLTPAPASPFASPPDPASAPAFSILPAPSLAPADACPAPGPDRAANSRCALKLAQRAENEAHAGRRDAALASLAAAQAAAPDDLRFALAHAQLRLAGKTPPTLAQVDAALRATPDDPGLLMMHGAMSLQAKKIDATLADTARVIQLRPDAALPHELRAQAFLAREDYAAATPEVDRALALAPDSTDSLRLRGNLRTIAGDYPGALADVEAAHKLDPRRDDAFLVGGTQFVNRRFAEAAASLAVPNNISADGQYWTLWRYLALARLHGTVAARGSLGPGTTPGTSIAWPGVVIDYFLGTIAEDKLLADARAVQAADNQSQVCEAKFYIGQEALLRGRRDAALALFHQTVAECPRGFHEYAGAQAELAAAAAGVPSPPPVNLATP